MISGGPFQLPQFCDSMDDALDSECKYVKPKLLLKITVECLIGYFVLQLEVFFSITVASEFEAGLHLFDLQ